MSLPRNDSASIISSLQMDYGDSDEDESDPKQNSFSKSASSDTNTTDSTAIEMKIRPVVNSAPIISDDDKEVIDVKPADLFKNETADSPVDNISDDEHDSQTSHSPHRRHRHHHHHHSDTHVKEEPLTHKDVYSEAMNTDSPASQSSVTTKASKKATSLVSYGHDEDVESEGEQSEEEEEDAENDSGSESPSLNATDASILSRSVQNMANDDIKIPPEPPGKCPYPLQRKIEVEYERMKREGVDHNRNMQERKSFRNPSIYEKLIDFCHIDENGTNFPPEIYNPYVWGKESVYDELDKAQRKDMERREKEKRERTKIEFLTGTKKPSSMESLSGPDEKKRKTKWDAQPGIIQAQYAKLPASQQNPGVVNLTATATGTKGKVISAVGSLSKKPSSSK